MAEADNNEPSAALAGKFRVKGTTPGVCYTRKHQRVDLRDISLATAEQLVAEGFEFLEAIDPEAKPEPEAAAPAEPEPPAPARSTRRRKTPAA